MARPLKEGLDYFSLDVDFLNDSAIRKLRQKRGSLGVIVYISLLCHIYKKHGYYAILDDDLVSDVTDDLSGKYAPDTDAVSAVIEDCISLGLIVRVENSKTMAAHRGEGKPAVITSRRVQIQFLLSSRRRKSIEVDGTIWLLNQREMQSLGDGGGACPKIVNVDINPVNVDINPVNVDINTQKEIEIESKIHTYNARARASDIQTCGKPVENPVENSKETGITKEEQAACGKLCGKPVENSDDSESIPSIEDIMRLIDKYGYSVDAERFHEYYSKQLYRLKDGSRVDVPRMLAVWNTNGYGKKEERRKDSKSSTDNGSFDTDEFFRLALKKSYKDMEDYNDYT